jgi:hypothetical protein
VADEPSKAQLELTGAEVDFVLNVVQHTTYSGDLAAMVKLTSMATALVQRLERLRAKLR